jgi:hypothetical protein
VGSRCGGEGLGFTSGFVVTDFVPVEFEGSVGEVVEVEVVFTSE